MQSIKSQTLVGAPANLPILVDKFHGATGHVRIIRTICSFLGISLITLLFSLRLHTGALFPQHLKATEFGDCTAIAFGQTAADSIASVGESDCFVFNAAANDRVRIWLVKTSGTISANAEIINSANNQSVCSPIFGEINCVLQTDGEYQIVVRDYSGIHIGAYSLFIQRLNHPVGCSPLSFGALPVTGAITVIAQVDCFTLDSTIGDRIRLYVAETAGNNFRAHLDVLRPDGTALCSSFGAKLDCQVDLSGQYTILAKDWTGLRLGDYSLAVQRLHHPVGCSTLTFGELPVVAQITLAAEMDCYTFSATTNDIVRIRAIETGNSPSFLFFELFDPYGGSVCSSLSPEQTCNLTVDADYMLLIQDYDGTQTGPYAVYLQRLTAPVNCTNLGLNDVLVGSIDVAAQVNCYLFPSAGNGTLNLNLHELSGQLSAYAEIVRPEGTTLCRTSYYNLACQLDRVGSHTILIKDSRGTLTGTYQLVLQCTLGLCVATPTPTPALPVATPTPTPRADSEHPVYIPYIMR